MLLIPYPSIPNTSLISSRLGPEAQQSLIIKSEPHSSKWENWHPKSVLSESKVHTFLLRRLRFIYSPTVCPIAPALFVEKPIIPPLNCFFTFVKKKNQCVYLCESISDFSVISIDLHVYPSTKATVLITVAI